MQYPTMQVPQRLPLVVAPANRNSTTAKDARLVNCYIELDDSGELFIYNRPGISENSRPPGADVAGYGLYTWNGDVYSIFGSTLYRNGVSVSTVLDNSQQVYRFTPILGATPKLVLGNGTQAYSYSVAGGLSATLHGIDNDFPSPFVKGWAYLNGAVYVMNPQAVIWGSAINSVDQPGDWDPLNFISAQIEPDPGVALSKQLVYVIAFNTTSTEVFFDAGNATGSPLGSVPGSKISFGCVSADSVQSSDTKIFWLATSAEGGRQIAMIEGLAVTIVSTDSIDRLLEAADVTTVYSFVAKLNGHQFYVITFKESNLTLAYDAKEELWHQWTDASGNYFPFVASTVDAQNRCILQHESNGRLYELATSNYNDAGTPIDVFIYTPNFDAGTRRRKTMTLMSFIGDKTTGSVIEVSSSDDDYQTWSNPRKVYMSQTTPQLTNCGTFRKRAFRIRHRSNTPFRLQAVELQYDIGVL